MKALYYQPYHSFLILTPKAFKKIKHLTSDILVSHHHGFYLLRTGCPFFYQEYTMKNKDSVCFGCKSRLKKELGDCGFQFRPENPERFSLEPIVSFLKEKNVKSSENIYSTYNRYCYDEYEGFEEIGWPFLIFVLLMFPLIQLMIVFSTVFDWLKKPFAKK